MMNQVILIGRINNDFVIKNVEGVSQAVVELKVQRSFKNLDGEYEFDYIEVVVLEGLATSIETYCKKGTTIAVKARIECPSSRELRFVAEKITYLSTGKVE